MAATARQENVVDLAEVRAERRAALPVSLEMDWSKLHSDDEERWEIGRTIWFAVIVSTALWALIAGAIWLV